MIGPTEHCPQGIELIYVDLDDTLLVDGKILRPRVADALALARERGTMICVSSGRALHMVPAELRKPQTMDYLICANGARVYDTIHGVMYERLMEREQVLGLMDTLRTLHPGWYVFAEGITYFEWKGLSYMMTGRRQPLDAPAVRKGLHTGGTLRQLRRAARFVSRMLDPSSASRQVLRVRPYVEASERGITKVGCQLPSRALCERAMEVITHAGCFEVARMSATELEITARGATKGTAATWLMDYLHVDPVRAVAFGDSENDVPLAQVCGTFVAMANGDAAVREMADDVCESVYDDGVARWIERALAQTDGARHV